MLNLESLVCLIYWPHSVEAIQIQLVSLWLIFHFFPLRFAARYFSDAPPVFQRLFFTSEESSGVQYGPRRMKLRDLMVATLRFLQSDCAKFRIFWDWSPCVSQLLTSDVMVRGYVPISWPKWGCKSFTTAGFIGGNLKPVSLMLLRLLRQHNWA